MVAYYILKDKLIKMQANKQINKQYADLQYADQDVLSQNYD